MRNKCTTSIYSPVAGKQTNTTRLVFLPRRWQHFYKTSSRPVTASNLERKSPTSTLPCRWQTTRLVSAPSVANILIKQFTRHQALSYYMHNHITFAIIIMTQVINSTEITNTNVIPDDNVNSCTFADHLLVNLLHYKNVTDPIIKPRPSPKNTIRSLLESNRSWPVTSMARGHCSSRHSRVKSDYKSIILREL